MVERPTMSEPFQSMAIDIMGPLPKPKGGVRYLLTCVCMATRWPDVVVLKNCAARAVADGQVEMFSRTGLPSSLLSDQGPQFTGSLMRELISVLGIDKIQTTAYHPQFNGVVERLLATLDAILTKAYSQGLDLCKQLPFAHLP